ncbi:AMP-dependent synthetase and ligase [Nakamurella multipartita DSM 44233]|uniref:AMP-dependent synthetase and ligase n=2 Tax=Nakamurella TaxID=53460 RepID=C8XKX1_NAKMY|nr:AMP-dependent synthetase and ligase [Nakamurella multipartita DSM 44233]
MMNTAEYLLSRADSSSIAIVDGESTFTYGQLRATVSRLSADIAAVGTRPGERVGILARNSFFWVTAYLATMYSGRVAVPLPTTNTPDQMRRHSELVDIQSFLVDRPQIRRFATVLDHSPTIEDPGIYDGSDSDEWAPVPVEPDSDAVFQLTSGTTAAPKAVRVTHANIQANTASIIEYLRLDADDRMLVVLPFSYCFGASLLHTHLCVGGSVALCHSLTFPETVIDAIDTHGCTGFAGVPSTYQLLLRASSLRHRRLPTLRHLQQAGGKLPPNIVDDLVRAQPHARTFVMYGQTEATARLSYLPPQEIERHRGSIGRGIAGVTLQILDSDDHEVAFGEVGELVATGPSITKGYWNDPVATAEKYRGGVLRTGDLATVDEDGFIYIVDRLGDFIKSWGFRVSSHEVEDAALQIAGVFAAAAVGVPDEDAGEAIALFVVCDSESVADGQILSELRGRLPKHMVPRWVQSLPELPLNANGKPIKAELRELSRSFRERPPGPRETGRRSAASSNTAGMRGR